METTNLVDDIAKLKTLYQGRIICFALVDPSTPRHEQNEAELRRLLPSVPPPGANGHRIVLPIIQQKTSEPSQDAIATIVGGVDAMDLDSPPAVVPAQPRAAADTMDTDYGTKPSVDAQYHNDFYDQVISLSVPELKHLIHSFIIHSFVQSDPAAEHSNAAAAAAAAVELLIASLEKASPYGDEFETAVPPSTEDVRYLVHLGELLSEFGNNKKFCCRATKGKAAGAAGRITEAMRNGKEAARARVNIGGRLPGGNRGERGRFRPPA